MNICQNCKNQDVKKRFILGVEGGTVKEEVRCNLCVQGKKSVFDFFKKNKPEGEDN